MPRPAFRPTPARRRRQQAVLSVLGAVSALGAALVLGGCARRAADDAPSGEPSAAPSAVGPTGVGSAAADASATRAGAEPETGQASAPQLGDEPAEGPRLAATRVATTVYERPHTSGKRLGYLRLGAIVRRTGGPVKGSGCKEEWYPIEPTGWVCMEDATIDLDAPLVRATRRRPSLDRPLPYQYGFVRATAPQYLRIPTHAEQLKSEFALEEHLAWFAANHHEVQRIVLGANDLTLDEQGVARPGLPFPDGRRLSTELSRVEVFGGSDGRVPWWLEEGRAIANVSGFEVPDYAVFADRVRRKTGLSFVDAFDTADGAAHRGFAVTVDMRLIPTSKVKPDTGSPFHGVELTEGMPVPFAFVLERDTTAWQLMQDSDEARPAEPLPRRALVPLSGQARIKAGRRFYQTLRDGSRWVQAADVGVVAPPPTWPDVAEKGERWIDISLVQQVLVLYEGKRPWYATLISSGRDRLGDPEKDLATPRGTFRIQSKHVAAAMDSEENTSVAGGTKSRKRARCAPGSAETEERIRAEVKAGKKLSQQDNQRWLNIQKGRCPEYGVTERRGADGFELRDVPWIQFFAAGFALHGAYWHDVFGTPRSHGCVNLSPIDARVVFLWTEPSVPAGWHGVNVAPGAGTLIQIRE